MNKRILRLAVPNILSNLSIPVLSSGDTAVVGHLDKIHYLGAIAVGSMIFNFIYWAFGFLRMGTTGLTAQAYGQSDNKRISMIMARSLTFAVSIAFLLIVIQSLISHIAFYLVDSTPDVEKYARQYFDIRIFAAPATLSLYAFHGWFLGMQNAKYPLFLSLFVNGLNIVFNLMFIYGFGMKSNGVALGTVYAQYLGLSFAVLLFIRSYRGYIIPVNLKELLEVVELKKFFNVNFDIFIRTLCLISTFSFFTAKSAGFGEGILAANTILLQLWMILSYGVDGFAFAAESLVGNFKGEGDDKKLKKVINLIFAWGLGLASLVALVYGILGREIVSFYTDKIEVIELAMKYFIWTLLAPFINSIAFIWDGMFIGATETKIMRNSVLISTLVFFLPVFYLTKGWIGNHGLWLAMISFMFLRGFSLTLYRRTIYSLKPSN